MTFKLTIKTSNAAFADGNATSEVASLLRETAAKLERSCLDGNLHDSNGNKVGTFTLKVPGTGL